MSFAFIPKLLKTLDGLNYLANSFGKKEKNNEGDFI